MRVYRIAHTQFTIHFDLRNVALFLAQKAEILRAASFSLASPFDPFEQPNSRFNSFHRRNGGY